MSLEQEKLLNEVARLRTQLIDLRIAFYDLEKRLAQPNVFLSATARAQECGDCLREIQDKAELCQITYR